MPIRRTCAGDSRSSIPRPPRSPELRTSRRCLILAALIASFVAGADMVYVRHLLRPVFVTPRQFGLVTGLLVRDFVGMALLDQRRSVPGNERRRYVWPMTTLVVLGLGIPRLQTHIDGLRGEMHA